MSNKVQEQLMDVGAGTAVSSSAGARGTYEDPTSRKKDKSKDEDTVIKKPVDDGKEYAALGNDKEYTTHFAVTGGFKNSAAEWLQILEQNAADADIPTLPGEKTASPMVGGTGPAPTTPDAPKAGDSEMPADPSMGGDMGMGGMGVGGDMGMGGGDAGGGQLSSNEIGRIYELKKIYSRLTTIETFLQEEMDERMVELRTMISKAIDLFETVISNIPSYKDKLDDIIISFYQFLDKIFEEIRVYFKTKDKKSKE